LSQSLLNEVWFPTYATVGILSILLVSQSLLNEVWFPTFSKYTFKSDKSVAIPSKWGLVSYVCFIIENQTKRVLSQSLLNEVWFPTNLTGVWSAFPSQSQSLLNEVWFPTGFKRDIVASKSVAIPSKWGLVSYEKNGQGLYYMIKSQSLLNEVWFPTGCSKNILMSFLKMSQSLLNEVWFPTQTLKARLVT